jgi:hypothetical protein
MPTLRVSMAPQKCPAAAIRTTIRILNVRIGGRVPLVLWCHAHACVGMLETENAPFPPNSGELLQP